MIEDPSAVSHGNFAFTSLLSCIQLSCPASSNPSPALIVRCCLGMLCKHTSLGWR